MHSTLTALIDITDNRYLNIDGGLINGILFIDLRGETLNYVTVATDDFQLSYLSLP